MMLCNLLHRCRSQTITFIRNCQTVSTTPRTTLSFLQLSTKTQTCVSDSVKSETCSDEEEESNSFLSTLQTFGFAQTHITTIVSKQPRALQLYLSRIVTSQPDKYLKPKLDFLLSIVQSESDVINIVTKNPLILIRSLNNQLIPFYSLLKSVTGSDENAAAAIKCNPFLLTFCIPESFVQNIEFLQTLGVPQNQILKLLTKYGQAIGQKHDKFRKEVMKIKEMGFDLSSSYFLNAVNTLSFLSDLTWESRCEAYRSFGMSNNEILNMFKKQPYAMCYTEKRIRELLGFYIHTLGWSPTRLAHTPNVLLYSLKKRVIPRCSVMQVLESNEIDYKRMLLTSILQMTDSKFLERFVTAFKDEVPEVMDAYQGKLTFDEYCIE